MITRSKRRRLQRRRLQLLAAATLAILVATPGRVLADEPAAPTGDGANALDPLRERFRAGMEKYRAGAFADAILIWSAIYSELGVEKGYRLAFNIARAYDGFGENSTQAAEYYEAYVKETTNRRGRGETLEPTVEKQETEAKARLAELASTKGRIEVRSDGRPIAVRIDDGATRLAGFVAYVTPGKVHVVTYGAGTAEERRIEVNLAPGKLVSVSPPEQARDLGPEKPRPSAEPRYETRTERPYSPVVLYMAVGVTTLSVIVPLVLAANANSIKDDYDRNNNPGMTDAERARLETTLGPDYDSAKNAAYAAYAIPAVLGAATIGLAAYWLWGGKEIRVPVSGTPRSPRWSPRAASFSVRF